MCEHTNFCEDIEINRQKYYRFRDNASSRKCNTSTLDGGCDENNDDDIDRCCTLKHEYDACEGGEGCIDGFKCSTGRYMGSISGGPEKCLIDFDRHWGCLKGGEWDENDHECLEEYARCSVGFIQEGSHCVINEDGNWGCKKEGVFDEDDIFCNGGHGDCIPGSSRAGNLCILDIPDIHVEEGCLKEGYGRDSSGQCSLRIYDDNGVPTNYLEDEDGLNCEQGYKLIRGDGSLPPICEIDIERGWVCTRESNLGDNDGHRCCDPTDSQLGARTCQSSPTCPAGKSREEGNRGRDFCWDGQGGNEEDNCRGEWSECDSSCENQRFIISHHAVLPFGNPCYDVDGVTVLREGQERSCIGRGSCTASEDDFLCGETSFKDIQDPDSISMENEEFWEWRWMPDDSRRERCDKIYIGGETGCTTRIPGDRIHDRIKCTLTQGKCKNNTNLDENHECSGPLYERADIEMLDLEPEEIPHEIQACIDRRKLEGYNGPYMSDEDCVCCSDMLQEGASIELAVGVLR
jgi:hypothetical protein